MPNLNGLISSRDVSATGEVASNFFVRKGDPIPAPTLVSPVVIPNVANDETMVLTETTDGISVISNTGNSIQMQPASGDVFIVCDSTAATTAGLTVRPRDDDNACAILRLETPNDAARYELSVSQTSTSGRSSNDLQIFSYYPGQVKLVLDANQQGNVVALGDANTVGGCQVMVNGPEGYSRVYDETYNPVDFAEATATPVLPDLSGGQINPNVLRPLFLDSNNRIVTPSSPLVRWFRVGTPVETGQAVTIVDPDGNKYDKNWICCCVGFFNEAGDRSYQAYTYPPDNNVADSQHWGVTYDNASATAPCFVQILAISTQLVGYAEYNTL